jgi:hypothetical protein
MSPSTRRRLRIAVLVAAAIGTVFWLAVCAKAIAVPPVRRNGFELMGAALSTLYFLALVLPTLILGLLDRWLVVAAVLGMVIVVIATDAVLPWLNWSLLVP